MIRSTLSTFTQQTIGRVRLRTSTKTRSMMFVVFSWRHSVGCKLKKAGTSDRSFLSCLTMLGAVRGSTTLESGEGVARCASVASSVDGRSAGFNGLLILASDLVHDVLHLVSPALIQHLRINHL